MRIVAKILIDARESGTSTGRYEDKLVEYLAKLQTVHQIIVLTKSHRVDYLKRLAPEFEIVRSDIKEFTFAEQVQLKKQIESLTADLVHYGMVQQPVLYRGRTVTTMHDLIMTWEKNPSRNQLLHWTKQKVYIWLYKQVARRTAAIITPSDFVKNDLLRFAKIKPEKITVTYEAADKISDNPEPLRGLEGSQFIMYVGRPSPHKNLGTLIEAYASLRSTLPNLKLVLAGKLDDNYLRYQETVKANAIKGVVFTDFVSEGQLRWLYEHCRAYIFPSLSEGFGLPGLEADRKSVV